jgi:catechol 2,3-dioxygenase-like lactoylglutathione lyase family enzyme
MTSSTDITVGVAPPPRDGAACAISEIPTDLGTATPICRGRLADASRNERIHIGLETGAPMGLSNYKVSASIAVSDIARAETFYEGKLGLRRMPDDGHDSHRYACGEGTALHVYVSPANAGNAAATLATWYVPDLEHVVDELSANGVTFERYDDPQLQTDARGIHSLGDGQVAWFKDPDGNTFAIEQ